VNEGVNIPPRGQSSPLGARGEVKNGPHFYPSFGVFTPTDKATEDAIAQSILKKNMTQLMTIIFKGPILSNSVLD
jgi:hypothetical protein